MATHWISFKAKNNSSNGHKNLISSSALPSWKRVKDFRMVFYFHDHKRRTSQCIYIYLFVAIRSALVSNNNVKRAWSIFTWLLYVPELVFIFSYNQTAWFSLYIHTYIYIYIFITFMSFKYDLLKVIYSLPSNIFIK
jgi:hypothetical protein